MNTSGKLFRTAACVAAALSLTVTAACSDDAAPNAQPTTDTSAPAPVTSPSTPSSTPTQKPSAHKTPKPSAKVTPTKSKTTVPPTAPATKPALPKGPYTKVEASNPGDGNYGLVRKDTTKPRDPRTKQYPLTCQWPESIPLFLKLDGTTTTVGKNKISTRITNNGVVIFSQNGSVLPSTTLIANKKQYTNLDSASLAKPLLLSSGPIVGSWDEITELVVCRLV